MSLLGVLHGVGHEVGAHLLDAGLVEARAIVLVGVVGNEGHLGVLHALGQRLADVVEGLCEVEVDGIDAQLSGIGIRGFKNVVDESEQHVAVVQDDVYELFALGRVFHELHEVGEAHDGVERRAYLVGHVGQEGTLAHARVFGPGSLYAQLLLRFHQLGDVACHAEVALHAAILVV